MTHESIDRLPIFYTPRMVAQSDSMSPSAHSSQSERLFRAFRTPHRSGATFF